MLENRLDDPCEFIADYFKNVIQGTSPLVRSYRFLGLCRVFVWCDWVFWQQLEEFGLC